MVPISTVIVACRVGPIPAMMDSALPAVRAGPLGLHPPSVNLRRHVAPPVFSMTPSSDVTVALTMTVVQVIAPTVGVGRRGTVGIRGGRVLGSTTIRGTTSTAEAV